MASTGSKHDKGGAMKDFSPSTRWVTGNDLGFALTSGCRVLEGLFPYGLLKVRDGQRRGGCEVLSGGYHVALLARRKDVVEVMPARKTRTRRVSLACRQWQKK
eukprot:532297-Hanusia_phi.AAC.1